MVDRRNTPDILGDLLGGSPSRSSSKSEGKESGQALPKQRQEIPKIPMPEGVSGSDLKYFESLLEHAGSALVLVAEVLGKQKLVDWLEEMLDIFASDTSVASRKAPGASFKQNVATWAEKHLGARHTDTNHFAHGLLVTNPYEVDIRANFKGEGAQRDLDVWIECMDLEETVKKRDIMKLVQKATDVFHAAHTDKQEFWFDRLILVTTSSFAPEALDLADQVGVSCVTYDGTSFSFKNKSNWKLKPNWLRDAQASEGITWHQQSK
mgnify:CR=1 FL=1